MNKEEYNKLVEEKSPNSNLLKNILMAFIFGGLLCVVGECISVWWQSKGLSLEHSAAATSIVMIFIGGFLTGIGVYDKIAKIAGAGTIVPITGFSNSIVSPAIEFKSEGLVMGIGSKMFAIAGPVLVYGTIASIVAGIVHYFIK